MPKYNSENVVLVYDDEKDLAKAATAAGMNAGDFIKMLYANQRDARLWNTCRAPFVGEVLQVNLVERSGGFSVAQCIFKVPYTEEYGDTTEINTGILGGKESKNAENLLATKVKEQIGNKVLVFYGYIINKDGSANKRLLDITPLAE
jgi:hypothetical protein